MDAADEKNQVQRNVDSASKTDTGLTQFHPLHSNTIQLQEDSTVALCQNFAHGYVFSKQPLVAGEIFLLDVKAAGTKDSFMPFPMVLQLKPTMPNASDLLDSQENLLFVVKQPYDAEEVHNDLGGGHYVKTARGLIPKSLLIPTVEVYLRIGIFFLPMKDDPKKAQINVIVNGKNLRLVKHSITFDDLPLYVMIMHCGTIKEIRIIQYQYQGVLSLQNACRNVIHESYTIDEICELPIPVCIKRFLTGPDC